MQEMYQLNPRETYLQPFLKLQEWGLTQQMIDTIKNSMKVSPAGFYGSDNKDSNLIRSTDVDWIDFYMHREFYSALNNVIHRANNELFKYAITHLEPCQYGVYAADKSGHYDTHTDGDFKGQFGYVRKISFSILISDPKDFEGGELLLLPHFEGIKTNLQKNEICFFPSWLPHKVTPVTKGSRTSIVGWIQGPDFV